MVGEVLQPQQIEHLLLIAGPSGAGKSTFIRALVDGQLPEEITAHLPQEARKWPRTSAKELAAKGLTAIISNAGQCPELVVHYDIMRPYSKGYKDYAQDLTLSAITARAVKVTVTTVLPTTDRLLGQYLARANGSVAREVQLNAPLLKRLRRRARPWVSRVFRRREAMKLEQLRILDLYKRPGGMNRWSNRWGSFLGHLSEEQNRIRLIYVAPVTGADGRPSFRLTRLG